MIKLAQVELALWNAPLPVSAPQVFSNAVSTTGKTTHAYTYMRIYIVAILGSSKVCRKHFDR